MIKKHSIIWFYVFTFIFTIILGGTAQALSVSFIPKQYQIIFSLVLAEMAPILGTLLVCLGMKDWSCWKNINWNPFKNAKGVLWLLLSFIIPSIVVAGAAAILSALGKAYISNGYSGKLVIVTIIGLLIGSIGEEIGWRGFMLPSFNRKYSLLNSAVFTGILWGAWHFFKLAAYGILGYLLFILLITEFSLMMAWIYSKSNRNMICMVLFHLGVNASSMLLLTGREGIMFYTAACIISTLICLVIVLADRKKFGVKLSSYES
jgi:membrane protease YdiL (CAAX protease family)